MKLILNISRPFEFTKNQKFVLSDGPYGGIKHLPLKIPWNTKVGSFIFYKKKIVAQIEEVSWVFKNSLKKEKIFFAKTKEDFFVDSGEHFFDLEKKGYSLGVITLSDKGFEGKREDKSAPIILSMIKDVLPISFEAYFMIPDEIDLLRYLLTKLSLEDGFDLVITTGGTGVTSRDITADVTEKLVEKRLLGFEWAILSEGFKKTPHAIISRSVCGIIKETAIINLPGSPRAVKDNLSTILPALSHFMEKLKDSPVECAS